MSPAIPMEIISIENEMTNCTVSGISVHASVSLDPHAKVGDWAIVRAGFAIELLDKEEAKRRLSYLMKLRLRTRIVLLSN